MVNDYLLRYFNILITDLCTRRGYDYTKEIDKITISKGDNKVKFKIKRDLFINKDHVEHSFEKLQENIESRLEKNESY